MELPKLLVLIIFALTYVFIIALPKYKVLVTLITAVVSTAICLIAGKMNFIDYLLSNIDKKREIPYIWLTKR